MNIYVDALRIDFEAEVDEGVAAFREEDGVCLLDCLFDCRGFDRAVVNEEEEDETLDMVICVTDPSACLESPAVARSLQLYEFIGGFTAVNCPDAVDSAGTDRDGN